MAAGEVQFLGTPIESDNYSGFPDTNINNDNLTDNWSAANANSGWVGLDLGAEAPVTRARIAPRPGDLTLWNTGVAGDYELAIQNAQIQSSASATFASGITTYATVPTFPYAPRYQFTEITTPGGAAARYWRSYSTVTGAYGGQLSELQFIGPPTAGVNARPVTPTLSLWGGRFPKLSAKTTVSSLTTSATFYYTTDGTDPSSANGTQTGGPISLALTAGATTTLKVIACDPTCSTPSSTISTAYFSGYGYEPNDNWYDSNRGILIEAHNGSVFDDTARSGKYYWYGAGWNQACAGNPGSYDLRIYHGLNCYSSNDMLNWKFESSILNNPSGQVVTINPYVLYNAANNNYVMWAQVGSAIPLTRSTLGAAVATAPTPLGPWTWENDGFLPDSVEFCDMCLAIDPSNGTGYVAYSSNSGVIVISELSSNFQTTTGTKISLTFPQFAESPALLKRGSVWFMGYSSPSNYYDSTLTFGTQYAWSTTGIMGTWNLSNNPWPGGVDPVGGNYNSQTRQFMTINGQVMWKGDFFVANNLYASRQVWLPVDFPTPTSMQYQQPATWDLGLITDGSSGVALLGDVSTASGAFATGGSDTVDLSGAFAN